MAYELGDMLRFNRPDGTGQAEEFDAYDENDPWRKINLINLSGQLVDADRLQHAGQPLEFFMNFLNTSTVAGFVDDGKDTIFGDNGDDWIVGRHRRRPHVGRLRRRLHAPADDDLNSIPDSRAPADPYANDTSDVPPTRTRRTPTSVTAVPVAT